MSQYCDKNNAINKVLITPRLINSSGTFYFYYVCMSGRQTMAVGYRILQAGKGDLFPDQDRMISFQFEETASDS